MFIWLTAGRLARHGREGVVTRAGDSWSHSDQAGSTEQWTTVLSLLSPFCSVGNHSLCHSIAHSFGRPSQLNYPILIIFTVMPWGLFPQRWKQTIRRELLKVTFASGTSVLSSVSATTVTSSCLTFLLPGIEYFWCHVFPIKTNRNPSETYDQITYCAGMEGWWGPFYSLPPVRCLCLSEVTTWKLTEITWDCRD